MNDRSEVRRFLLLLFFCLLNKILDATRSLHGGWQHHKEKKRCSWDEGQHPRSPPRALGLDIRSSGWQSLSSGRVVTLGHDQLLEGVMLAGIPGIVHPPSADEAILRISCV